MERQPEFLNQASDDLRNAASILAGVRKVQPTLLDIRDACAPPVSEVRPPVVPAIFQSGRNVLTGAFRTKGGNRVMRTARLVGCTTPLPEEPPVCVGLSSGFEFEPNDAAEESNIS